MRWRRALRDNEKEWERELGNRLSEVQLSEEVEDGWKWKGCPRGIYSVKDAYHQIEMRKRSGLGRGDQLDAVGDVWSFAAPFKAKLTAWRLALNRLPTRDNLKKRNMLPSQETTCVCCGSEDESVRHLFMECREANRLWARIAGWIGVYWVQPREILAHQQAFSNLGKGKHVYVLGGLWICFIWVWWK